MKQRIDFFQFDDGSLRPNRQTASTDQSTVGYRSVFSFV